MLYYYLSKKLSKTTRDIFLPIVEENYFFFLSKIYLELWVIRLTLSQALEIET